MSLTCCGEATECVPLERVISLCSLWVHMLSKMIIQLCYRSYMFTSVGNILNYCGWHLIDADVTLDHLVAL